MSVLFVAEPDRVGNFSHCLEVYYLMMSGMTSPAEGSAGCTHDRTVVEAKAKFGEIIELALMEGRR